MIMIIIECLLFLLFGLVVKGNVVRRLEKRNEMYNSNMNSTREQIFNENSSSITLIQTNSSIILFENETLNGIVTQTLVDNIYIDKSSQESNLPEQQFCSGLEYHAEWKTGENGTVATFSLNSSSKLCEKTSNSNSSSNNNEVEQYLTMASISSCKIQTIDSLEYFRFTILEYGKNASNVLEMTKLNMSMADNIKSYSNALRLKGLDTEKNYTICIYYYQTNRSMEIPHIFICQNIIRDNREYYKPGFIFILTQYSIILVFLVILQVLYSIRKRRIAHIVHQHLLNKAQRLRSTLSSVSFVRQFSNPTETTTEEKQIKANGHAHSEKNILKKRIISSPAIVLSEPSVPLNRTINSTDENEPFLKLATGKNHVHFLLGLDEESDTDIDEDDDNNNNNDTIPNNTIMNPSLAFRLSEPYGDQSDALLSMAHILDSNKPWSRQL